MTNVYKEWTDHKNGYRYYIDYLADKVQIRIATYPDRETVFKTEVSKDDFNTFLDYIQSEEK